MIYCLSFVVLSYRHCEGVNSLRDAATEAIPNSKRSSEGIASFRFNAQIVAVGIRNDAFI